MARWPSKWTAESGDSPKRDLRRLREIFEIVSRFDVIAIREVMGDLRALRDMMDFFGPHWPFFMTDITLGAASHGESMAVVFDNRRVRPSGLACELVAPPEWLSGISPDALRSKFARTFCAVSFRAGDTTFILVALRIIYGDTSTDRVSALKGIVRINRRLTNFMTRLHGFKRRAEQLSCR